MVRRANTGALRRRSVAVHRSTVAVISGLLLALLLAGCADAAARPTPSSDTVTQDATHVSTGGVTLINSDPGGWTCVRLDVEGRAVIRSVSVVNATGGAISVGTPIPDNQGFTVESAGWPATVDSGASRPLTIEIQAIEPGATRLTVRITTPNAPLVLPVPGGFTLLPTDPDQQCA